MKPKSRAACSMCMGVRAVVAGALWLGWSVGVWGEVLVARATTWRYRKGTVEASDPRDAWRASDFDDSQWSKGTGAFGYGSGSFGTALPDMQNQYSTLFLRRTFTVTSLPEAVRLRAAVDYDDGFILWINGERVLDKNEPDGEPLYNSLAGGYVGAPGTFSTNEIAEAADCLEIGVNVVVVQVFNSSIGSGDCRFDLELSTFLRVADTKFSHDRGFYTSPFSLTVSTATPGATIRYTTDGRAVTASSTPAPAPYTNLVLSVGATKVLRAAAFKNGYEPTNVDTHTYVFPADVVTQSTMDTRIVNDPRYSGMIVSALEAIPSLCISGDPAKLQSNARIPDSDEYPISLELLHPNPVEEDFAVNCGLSFMTTGQYLTNCWKYKAQYNVYFKAAYGPGKLAYPLFGEDYPLREFNNLRLRAGSNDGWSWWADGIANTQYARDEFGRRTQLETGGVAARGTFVHLYVNGFYRGLYNPCEKPSESFMASHYGGEDEDYDVIKQGYQVVGGDLTAWNAMLNFAANNNLGVDANYETMKGYLDVVRFCDYNLIEIWGPNWDWAPPTRPVSGNNWRAGRKSRNRWPGDPQFTFFVWDYEVTLSMYTNNEYNCSCALTTDISGTYGIGNLHTYLKANPDYVQLFADRAYQWMGDGGVLSTSACVRRYRAITDEIENAVVPESARWGDDHASYVNAPLNRDDYWVPMRNYLLNTFLPQRTGIVLNQLRNRGLYPSLNPPTFHQHGGAIASGFRLTMSNPNGTGQIYYTLDGSDPRVFGGGARGQVSGSATGYAGPVTLSKTTHVKARVYKSSTTWSAAHACTYNFTAHHNRIRITEILYNPLGGGDFEFVEIKNTGTSTRGLSEMRFADGIRYTFAPGAELPAGGFALLVRNEATFTNRYPGVKESGALFGVYSGGLDNGGERLTLLDSDGLTATTLRYNDKNGWPEAADGAGYSLVAIDPNANPEDPANWRASNLIGGSPGYDDGEPYRVVISEALTHTDLPQKDAIELYNAGSAAAPIGGWYLSDTLTQYQKFQIPAGITLPAGGYLVFDEDDFNNPTGAPTSFALSSHGDEVYLTKFNASGRLEYLAEERFGGAANGVAFGRWVRSDGGVDFVAQAATTTLGAANSYPLVGPVVLNELMYHPAAGGDEFIELLNVSAATVKLYDPGAPTNRWKLSGGVEYVFPASTELAPGEVALVVATNASTFRSKYGLPSGLQIFGPYAGVLDNGGESVKLWRPDAPDENGLPWILVDRVTYNDNSPWPENADGAGHSLERQDPHAYGNDPANWASSLDVGGTPGAANSGGLVSKSAGWRYHDRGEDLGTAWRAAGYDDGAWRDGNGPLGYANVGDYPDLDTVLDYGDDPNNKPITTYFRKRFILGGDPANVTNLTLEAKYDDGFAAYLNGQEVARAGLSGTIAYGTLADNHDATSYMPFNLLAHKDKLVAGENVLAVELHQAGSTSSDLFWDAELRYAASQILPVATPTIAPNGGEFTTSVSVTIACTTAGATIFYRTDQADPTDQSYHGYGASPRVLTLSGSATVKARAYKAGLSPSGIAEATFTEILPTVATPTIAPAGGDFYGSVSVTIACGTTGATIFYRTDGTDATDQSYHGSGLSPRVFTLSDSATVKARAYKAEHNPSAVASASFTDRTPTVCFAGSTSSGSESASPASLAVVLSGTSPQTITVAYAVGGGTASGGGVDYTLAAGTLTFAAGQTNQTISVPVMDDSLEEAAETVVVSLVYPVNAVLGAPAAHTYTILDNDRLWTAYNDLAWTNGQLAQNITRYTRAQSGSLVDYASGTTIGASLAVDAGGGGPYVEQGAPAAAGTDAHGVFAGIVDAHGLISYGSNLTLRVAGLDSSLRYELVLFGNRDNAGYTDRLTTVTVSDAASFENASTPGAAFSGPSDDSTVVCNGWNTQNGYVVRYARIDPGPDGDVLLTVSDNASLFYLNALMVRASRPQADLPAVSFEQAALDVGESAGTVGLAVHLDQAWTNEVRVDYQTAGGTATPGRDYTAASGTLTFAAGQTQKTITLAIGNDGESEDDETVTVSLANPVEATIGAGTCTVTIEDDDGPELLFTAYNDLMWASGQLSANITLYTAYTGGGLPGSGHLVDYASGTNVSVTLGVSTEDTYRTTGYPEQGADAVAGAEAFETFNGKVNCAGLMSNGKHTLAFGGMDPAHRYSLVLFGNRDNSGYTALTTDFVISGVASFQNTSSPGTQILGSGAGPTNDLTRYCTGWNRTNGYVARFADIRPAAAGTMTLTVQGSAFYVNALMLQGFRPSESAAPVVKVGMGAQWAYRKGTAEAGSFWRVPSFDDGDWERGAAPFGYGDGSFGTTLDDMRYTYSCVFLRRAFEISSPALVSELVLDAEYDDGFIVWLNGEEVARVNMTGQPGEPVAFDNETAPLDSIEPTAWRKTCSAAGLPALLPGTNLLAVQVFNYLRNSSDLLFDLALSVVEGSAFAPSVDADRDGMPDDWEADQLGGTGQPGDADPDGDGLSSLEEYIAGTDPDELASIFGVSVRMDAGHALVRIPTVAAGGVGYAGLTRLYALEARSGMAGGEPWQLVPGYEAVVGNGLTAVYTNTAPGAATCYRARVWLED